MNSTKKKRLRSFSPKKLKSYKDLYHRKKSVEHETLQRSKKLFEKIDEHMQTFSVFSTKSVPAKEIKISHDFRSRYQNFNELLKIRQKHLELCNKYQK